MFFFSNCGKKRSTKSTVGQWHFQTHVSGCSCSPALPHWVSGSASCGETPEPRFVPFSPVLCLPRRGLAAAPCPIPLTPARVSSLRSYVSISHPNRGCAASAEARPTSGTAASKSAISFFFCPPSFSFSFLGFGMYFSSPILMSCLLLLHRRCSVLATRRPPLAALLSAAEYERFF